MSFRSVYWACLLSVFFAVPLGFGQKTSVPSNPEKNDSSRFDAEARQLIHDIFSQVPAKKTSLRAC